MTVLVPTRQSSPAEVASVFLLGFRGRTREAYGSDLVQWGRWLDGMGLDPFRVHRSHVELYVRELELSLARGSVARKLSVLSGFYRWCQDEGLIERSPLVGVRRPRVREGTQATGLDVHELRRLLDTAHHDSPRSYALISLLVLNGLRVSEALGADVGDLSSERGHRTLRILSKGEVKRTVPLAPPTFEAIEALGVTVGPVFHTQTGKRLDRQAAWKLVRRLARIAQVDKQVSPHSLRHSYCTLALDAGAPLHRVQDSMGHADPRTTQRYNRARASLDGNPTYLVAAELA